MLDIQQLREQATFSQTQLDEILQATTTNYERDQACVFNSPLQLLNGLQSLIAEGWKVSSRYTPVFVEPSYYCAYLTKPESQQASELAGMLQEAEEKYRLDLANNKQRLIEQVAIQKVQKQKEAERIKAERRDADLYAKAIAETEQELSNI